MKVKDLYAAIEQLGHVQYNYPLSNRENIDNHILRYNRIKRLWEFYFFDERGGRSDLKTFVTEEEACEYILNEAIETIKTFRDAWMDAIKRKYLGTILDKV